MADQQSPGTNHLLAALPDEEQARIRPLIVAVPLDFREDIYRSGKPTGHVWFPTSGVISLVTELIEGQPVEIATVGHEGMVGVQLLLGSSQMSHRAFVQVAGSALRMDAEGFRRALSENPEFQRLLNRYALSLLTQMAQSAACNRMHSVDERLARWLLQTHDRVQQREFLITQEFLAQMLGVRRPTVSLAASMLMRAGLIHYVRGVITILDRPGLEAASCECYAVIAGEFERLVGIRG